jgi:hypothetical protein
VSRRQADSNTVATKLPHNTTHTVMEGRDVYVFKKHTELGIEFEIAVYFDPDEGGYCGQLFAPAIEDAWKSPHVGHLFSDGVICMGATSMRTRPTLEDAYGRACLWAEGMAIMIRSHQAGSPSEFPFSINNSYAEADDPWRRRCP